VVSNCAWQCQLKPDMISPPWVAPFSLLPMDLLFLSCVCQTPHAS
jgi:hypothetical protein